MINFYPTKDKISAESEVYYEYHMFKIAYELILVNRKLEIRTTIFKDEKVCLCVPEYISNIAEESKKNFIAKIVEDLYDKPKKG